MKGGKGSLPGKKGVVAFGGKKGRRKGKKGYKGAPAFVAAPPDPQAAYAPDPNQPAAPVAPMAPAAPAAPGPVPVAVLGGHGLPYQTWWTSGFTWGILACLSRGSNRDSKAFHTCHAGVVS